MTKKTRAEKSDRKPNGKTSDWRKKELLTVPEVAEIFSESRSGMYSRIARGQIPAIRIGKSVRIPRVKLEEKLAKLIKAIPRQSV